MSYKGLMELDWLRFLVTLIGTLIILRWIPRVIHRIIRKLREPEPKETGAGAPPKKDSYLNRVGVETLRNGVPYRMGIRSTDLGIRKLSRHRSGRLYDKRSGFDHSKGMDDKDDDERPRRKKKTWFEDRKHD